MAFNELSEDIYRLEKSVASSDDTIITALARKIYDTVMSSQDVIYNFDLWIMADNEGNYSLQFIYDMYSTNLPEGLPITLGAVVSVQPFVDKILTTIREYSP